MCPKSMEEWEFYTNPKQPEMFKESTVFHPVFGNQCMACGQARKLRIKEQTGKWAGCRLCGLCYRAILEMKRNGQPARMNIIKKNIDSLDRTQLGILRGSNCFTGTPILSYIYKRQSEIGTQRPERVYYYCGECDSKVYKDEIDRIDNRAICPYCNHEIMDKELKRHYTSAKTTGKLDIKEKRLLRKIKRSKPVKDLDDEIDELEKTGK